MEINVGSLDLEKVRQAWAYKVLGVEEEPVTLDSDELEKLRKRTKVLYKQHMFQKNEDKAKKVLDAYDVLKQLLKKRKLEKRAAKKSEKVKPSPKTSAIRAESKTKQLKANDSNPRKDDIKSAACGRGTDAEKDDKKGREEEPARDQHRDCGNPSDRFGLLASSCETPALKAAETLARLRSAGTVLVCSKCGETCNLFRAPTLKSGSFSCPSCRILWMDPFNPVVGAGKGVLHLALVQYPTVPLTAWQVASFQFKLKLPGLHHWRKAGQSIEARMVRLDTCDARQEWPHSLSCSVNGSVALEIDCPKAGHKRRDVPKNISAYMSQGTNTVDISMKDGDVRKFAIAFVRTSPRLPRELCKAVECISEEDCKQRVGRILFSSMLEGTGDEVHCPGSNKSCLICPITLSRIETPARGKQCQHLQCFDLKPYMASNFRMAAFNRRWLCPVCNIVLRPPDDLFIDMYLLQILRNTQATDEEIAFENADDWKVTARSCSPGPPSSDEEAGGDAEDDGVKASDAKNAAEVEAKTRKAHDALAAEDSPSAPEESMAALEGSPAVPQGSPDASLPGGSPAAKSTGEEGTCEEDGSKSLHSGQHVSADASMGTQGGHVDEVCGDATNDCLLNPTLHKRSSLSTKHKKEGTYCMLASHGSKKTSNVESESIKLGFKNRIKQSGKGIVRSDEKYTVQDHVLEDPTDKEPIKEESSMNRGFDHQKGIQISKDNPKGQSRRNHHDGKESSQDVRNGKKRSRSEYSTRSSSSCSTESRSGRRMNRESRSHSSSSSQCSSYTDSGRGGRSRSRRRKGRHSAKENQHHGRHQGRRRCHRSSSSSRVRNGRSSTISSSSSCHRRRRGRRRKKRRRWK